MLLLVDIGNTETTIGIFSKEVLENTFRLETKLSETADEIAVDITSLLGLADKSFHDIDGVCISSVVPHCTAVFVEMSQSYLKVDPLVVGPGIKTGIPILYENPKEVGADRIANAVGCIERHGKPAVVVDFGTATTFDVISEKGEYSGGVIAPGIVISAEALFEKAARLSKVDLVPPPHVIGRNTQESIQSGIIYGTAGMVDSMVSLIKKELSSEAKVVATGGLCRIFQGVSKMIEVYDSQLTLYGLKTIYYLNRPG